MNIKSRIAVVAGTIVIIGAIAAGVIALQHKNNSQTSSNQGAQTVDNTTTPPASTDKVQVTDEVIGTGATAKVDDTITVKYTGTLTDGTVFDSTAKQGGTPATFPLSKGQLIDGWVQGIPGMKIGGKRKLVIPPSLGYGSRSAGTIPPNSTLVFEIELVGIK